MAGLDPAGPWFSANDSLLRIDIGDAQYVDTINTDGQGFISFGLGQVIGHVDFFPNNARRQPPCPEPCKTILKCTSVMLYMVKHVRQF